MFWNFLLECLGVCVCVSVINQNIEIEWCSALTHGTWEQEEWRERLQRSRLTFYTRSPGAPSYRASALNFVVSLKLI